jgi:hypothetical protein
MRAGEVIAKLVEDAYFMRVDNRVTQVPPLRTREPDNHEATSHSPAGNGCNRTEEYYPRTPTVLGLRPAGLLRMVTVLVVPAVVATLLIMVMLEAEAATAGAPHTGLAGKPVVEAIVEVEATQTATSPVPHAAAMMPAEELKKYDTRVLHGMRK